MLIEQISSDVVVDTAYQWLCQRRLNYSHNNDVWSLRRDWALLKPDLQQTLRAGEYQFGPLTEYHFPEQIVHVWQAADALVLKAMTLVLTQYWAPVLCRVGKRAAQNLIVLFPRSHAPAWECILRRSSVEWIKETA